MIAKIHVLHPHTPPLSGFLRVGHTGHRKLEALQAAGRFPYRRVVLMPLNRRAAGAAQDAEVERLRVTA